jgi:hypothetical protein
VRSLACRRMTPGDLFGLCFCRRATVLCVRARFRITTCAVLQNNKHGSRPSREKQEMHLAPYATYAADLYAARVNSTR